MAGLDAGYSDPDFQAFIFALTGVESGHSYSAEPHGITGALGAYQVEAANIPSWSQQALGHPITPAQFLASPQLQDEIAQYQLLKDWDSFAGQPGQRVLAVAKEWNPTADATYAQKVQQQWFNDSGKTFGNPTGANIPGVTSANLKSVAPESGNWYAVDYKTKVADPPIYPLPATMPTLSAPQLVALDTWTASVNATTPKYTLTTAPVAANTIWHAYATAINASIEASQTESALAASNGPDIPGFNQFEQVMQALNDIIKFLTSASIGKIISTLTSVSIYKRAGLILLGLGILLVIVVTMNRGTIENVAKVAAVA